MNPRDLPSIWLWNFGLENRLSSLVRRALQEHRISLGRGAEILGLNRDEMRQRIREWAN